MKKSILRSCICSLFFLVIAVTGFAQSPFIVVDGVNVLVSGQAKFPFWLEAGQTLATGTNVTSISVLEYNIEGNGAGNNLIFSATLKVTGTQSVPANKTWKVESVLLDPAAASGGGTVTHVTATAPVSITGIGTVTPNVLLSGTAGGVFYGTGGGSDISAAGTVVGQVLTSNTSGIPTWSTLTDLPATAGTLPVANGGTGSATQSWVDLSSAQTAAGAKTWSAAAAFTAGGTGLSVTNNATVGGKLTAGEISAPNIVIQTVYKTWSAATTVTAIQTYQDAVDGDLSITAKRNGSVFKITVNAAGYQTSVGGSGCNVGIKYANTNTLIVGTNGVIGDTWMGAGNAVPTTSWNITRIAFHSPGTVAGNTYTYRAMLGLWSAGTGYINHPSYNGYSIITIEEIAQ